MSETNITGEKNDLFYSQFTPLLDNISRIDILYDKVRNYVTQKPFSTDKIKLNFGNSQLLNGWDRNKEKDCGAVWLCKDEKYYLAIIDKSNNSILENIDFQDCDESDCYEKIIYKLLPGPNKMLPKVFFSEKCKKLLSPSDEILKIYKSGTFKKGDKFSLDDCHKLIDFYKESFKKYPKWLIYNFKFKNTNEYNDISEFYNAWEGNAMNQDALGCDGENTKLDADGRRIVLFAPNDYPWCDMEVNLSHVIRKDIEAGQGGSELEMNEVYTLIAYSM